MDFVDWEPIYKEIMRDLSLNWLADERSARELSEMVRDKKILRPGLSCKKDRSAGHCMRVRP